jgi:hypothetical protein
VSDCTTIPQVVWIVVIPGGAVADDGPPPLGDRETADQEQGEQPEDTAEPARIGRLLLRRRIDRQLRRWLRPGVQCPHRGRVRPGRRCNRGATRGGRTVFTGRRRTTTDQPGTHEHGDHHGGTTARPWSRTSASSDAESRPVHAAPALLIEIGILLAADCPHSTAHASPELGDTWLRCRGKGYGSPTGARIRGMHPGRSRAPRLPGGPSTGSIGTVVSAVRAGVRGMRGGRCHRRRLQGSRCH